AKKAHLIHGCNLALLTLLLSTTLLAGAQSPQEPTEGSVRSIELLSYEGQTISSLELAGQPDLDPVELMPLLAQRSGDDFSIAKINQTLAALRSTGKFKDVELDLRPEQDGVRVIFVLQPAIYFGVYQFPGAEQFPYSRLVLAASYVPQ